MMKILLNFHILIESDTSSNDEANQDEDAEMEDALSFITSEPDEKSKKRRPVRRKKPSD